ncbi:MAG: YidB family protein [Thiobacillus sp.]
MGLLDIVTSAMGGGNAGGGNPLLGIVMQMLTKGGEGGGVGGLAGLAKAFQDKGMGDQMSSWISTGQNLPISPEQIKAVLGGGQLGQIASQLGVNENDAAGGLADMLPQVVDKLTPNGQVPQEKDLMAKGLELLKGKLFG